MRISDWSSDVCSSDLLVGGVVVDDQMQVLVLGGLAVDGLEEPQPLLMSVELIGHRQYLAGKHVQCGKQGGHAIALVIVGHRLVASAFERKARLGAVECLNLGLFIDRKSTRLNPSH